MASQPLVSVAIAAINERANMASLSMRAGRGQYDATHGHVLHASVTRTGKRSDV